MTVGLLTAIATMIHFAILTGGTSLVGRAPVIGIPFMMGLEWLLNAVVVATTIWLLLPMLALHVDAIMPLSLIRRDAGLIFFTGVVASLLTSFVGAIPLVGGLLKSPGVSLFVESTVVFGMQLDHFLNEVSGQPAPSQAMPSLLASLGFLALGTAVGFALFLFIGRVFPRSYENGYPSPLAYFLSSVVSYVPLFMYTEYIRLSLLG